jgi:hypothetical protein
MKKECSASKYPSDLEREMFLKCGYQVDTGISVILAQNNFELNQYN